MTQTHIPGITPDEPNPHQCEVVHETTVRLHPSVQEEIARVRDYLGALEQSVRNLNDRMDYLENHRA